MKQQSVEELSKLLKQQKLCLIIYDKKANKPIYVQPSYIRHNYSMSTATVHRRLKEMKLIPEYVNSFIHAGDRKPLVKLVDFEKFLIEWGRQHASESN